MSDGVKEAKSALLAHVPQLLARNMSSRPMERGSCRGCLMFLGGDCDVYSEQLKGDRRLQECIDTEDAFEALVEVVREDERAQVGERLHWVLDMAWNYAEAGGSSGPEVRDFNEAMEDLGWEPRK